MVDQEKVREGVRLILEGIGEDINREGLIETPDRIARMYCELAGGMDQNAATHLEKRFHVDNADMVVEKDITFYSMCEHHLVPFHGVAHVAYIPGADGRITGLSKLARLVDVFAKRPQVQERLTTQVADALVTELGARGVMVVVEAEHLCMSMRGVRKPGSRTMTSAVRGVMRDGATRAEAMSLIAGR